MWGISPRSKEEGGGGELRGMTCGESSNHHCSVATSIAGGVGTTVLRVWGADPKRGVSCAG